MKRSLDRSPRRSLLLAAGAGAIWKLSGPVGVGIDRGGSGRGGQASFLPLDWGAGSLSVAGFGNFGWERGSGGEGRGGGRRNASNLEGSSLSSPLPRLGGRGREAVGV